MVVCDRVSVETGSVVCAVTQLVTVLSLLTGGSLVYEVKTLRLLDLLTGVTAELPYLTVVEVSNFAVMKLVTTHVVWL